MCDTKTKLLVMIVTILAALKYGLNVVLFVIVNIYAVVVQCVTCELYQPVPIEYYLTFTCLHVCTGAYTRVRVCAYVRIKLMFFKLY